MQDNAAQNGFLLSLNEGQWRGKAILNPGDCQTVPHCFSTTTHITRMDLSKVLGLNFKVESYFFLEDVVKGLWSCSLSQGRRIPRTSSWGEKWPHFLPFAIT